MTIQEKQNFTIRYSVDRNADCFCCGEQWKVIDDATGMKMPGCCCFQIVGTQHIAYCKGCKKCPSHCGCTARIIKTEEKSN